MWLLEMDDFSGGDMAYQAVFKLIGDAAKYAMDRWQVECKEKNKNEWFGSSISENVSIKRIPVNPNWWGQE